MSSDHIVARDGAEICSALWCTVTSDVHGRALSSMTVVSYVLAADRWPSIVVAPTHLLTWCVKQDRPTEPLPVANNDRGVKGLLCSLNQVMNPLPPDKEQLFATMLTCPVSIPIWRRKWTYNTFICHHLQQRLGPVGCLRNHNSQLLLSQEKHWQLH